MKIEEQVKTEKTLTELDLDLNLNFNLSKQIEDGRVLKNVYGPGNTGLENLGNSCYMNTVIQVLFTLEPFKAQFLDNALPHLMSCNQNSLECHQCQISKIMLGLHSGQYSKKLTRPIINSEGKISSEVDDYQLGIAPRSFKSFYNKGHEEFSNNKQQDALEYLVYLLEKLDKHEKSNLQRHFEFDIERKFKCTGCSGIKIKKDRNSFLMLNIPDWKFKKENGEKCKLDESINNWLGEENVEMNCQKCSKVTIWTKSQRLVNYPDYLIIVYQRFVYDWVAYKLDIDFVIEQGDLELSKLTRPFNDSDGYLIPEEKEEEEQVIPEFNKESLNFLLDMGIPELGAKHALLKNNQDGNSALDWYFNNSNDPTLSQPLPKVKKTQQKKEEFNLSDINQLMDFGFTREQAQGALRKFNLSIDQASDFLFNNPDYVFPPAEETKKVSNEKINLNNKENYKLICKILI